MKRSCSFEFEGLSQMLPNADEVGMEMAEAAGPVLAESTKKAVRRVVAHEGTSELVDSVKLFGPGKTRKGDYFILAYFDGYSKTKTVSHSRTHRGKYKVSNALKAIWKEYGIPSRGIPAQPFLERAAKAAEAEALDKMQEVFDRKVDI